MKKLILPSLLLCLFLLSSCDSDPSDATFPSCTTDEELLESDCPAETLADICEPFFCGATGGDPPTSADFDLPFADGSCAASDCFTLQCGETSFTVNIDESPPRLGLPSGLVNGELEYFCFGR